MLKKTIPFKAEYHDEDNFIADDRGVAVNMMMDSGIIRRFYLTHEAIDELHKASVDVRGAHAPTKEEPWS